VIAMASVSGRMPAVGVVADNRNSGDVVTVYTQGSLYPPISGLCNFTAGQPVFVGRSGQITNASGSFSSGGFSSGDLGQLMGVAGQTWQPLLNVMPWARSGGPLTWFQN
jgi:hypothetical protein